MITHDMKSFDLNGKKVFVWTLMEIFYKLLNLANHIAIFQWNNFIANGIRNRIFCKMYSILLISTTIKFGKML